MPARPVPSAAGSGAAGKTRARSRARPALTHRRAHCAAGPGQDPPDHRILRLPRPAPGRLPRGAPPRRLPALRRRLLDGRARPLARALLVPPATPSFAPRARIHNRLLFTANPAARCPSLRRVRLHTSDRAEGARLAREVLSDPSSFDVAVTTFEMAQSDALEAALRSKARALPITAAAPPCSAASPRSGGGGDNRPQPGLQPSRPPRCASAGVLAHAGAGRGAQGEEHADAGHRVPAEDPPRLRRAPHGHPAPEQPHRALRAPFFPHSSIHSFMRFHD